MERPNTVSGLVAKRAELVAYRKGLEAELRKVTVDIDHLDAAIRIEIGQADDTRKLDPFLALAQQQTLFST